MILFIPSLQADALFEEYTTTLQSIDGRFATIQDSKDIYVGSSGIVMHAFDETTATVVARVDVVEKKDGIAKLRFDVYKMSAQNAFPIPGVLPAIGDKVILNYLYDRSLIIAPNQNVFKEITEHFKNIEWIHPDVVAAYLAKEFKPNPDKEDFQEVCKTNATSLIFFALDSNGYFVDCHNFQVVKKYKSARLNQIQLPFYTRVPNIESSWFQWESGQISDYNSHYSSLIRN